MNTSGGGTSLSTLAATDTVENIVVFVSNALRYDSLPPNIVRLDKTTKAVNPKHRHRLRLQRFGYLA